MKKNWQDLNITEPYPIIEVRGTPFEMGKQHGEKAKEYVDRMFEYCFGITTKRKIGETEFDLINHGENLLPLSEKFAPELVEECRGIAQGSGYDFREVFAMQFFIDYGPPGNEMFSNSCSTVVATGTSHKQGHTLVGWNDDMPIDLAQTLIIHRAFPDRAPASASICFAGTIPECGATSENMVICNALPGNVVKEGIPYLFIQRKLLFAKTIQQGINIVTQAKRIIPMHFTYINKSGSLIGIETIPDQFEIFEATENCYCHTNHFLSSLFNADEIKKSVQRQIGLEHYLRKYRGSINRKNMFDILSDHEYGLCVHHATVATMICNLTAGEIEFSTGPPCLGNFQKIKL